jgi:hypothetical protein
MGQPKKNSQLLQSLERLENERRKDEVEIKLRKQQTIREVKSWDREQILSGFRPQKLSFWEKVKKIFGK